MSHKATNWLASIDPNLIGHSEFRVLFHLCDCHNPSQGCFPTQAYLIAQTGASNGTVNNALNALEQKGLIKRHRQYDGTSKRQKPTRYTLGFEIKGSGDGGGDPSPKNGDGNGGEPTPKTGDGNSPKPTPEIGDGADSNLEGDPSPIQRATRLQPTGEEPVINQIINQRGARAGAEISDIGVFWIGQIRAGNRVPSNAINPTVAREIAGSGQLTAEQLNAVGISGADRAS